LQTEYRIDPDRIGAIGVAVGAIAAAHAALLNPALFSRLALISPPLGKGAFQEQLIDYQRRFASADALPKRVFQSVGRYEAAARFVRPAYEIRSMLQSRHSVAYRFVETGSGHGLVGFRSVLPEAMSWALPGDATGR
jgi:pimeloyl-ACP methyl ester carboxylesterase